MRLKLCVVALSAALSATPAAEPQRPAKKTAPAAPAAKKSAPPAAAGAQSALNKQHLENYLRHLFVWGPTIKVEIGDFEPSPARGLFQTLVRASYGPAVDQQVFYVSADGKQIVRGPIYAADDNPFRSELKKITTTLQPSFGTPGAPVVLVVYSDFQCPHCREEAKILRDNMLKNYPTQVRVYFKDMPLANHDWARTSAIAGRCIFRQNPSLFWDYHDWIFENQPSITAANFQERLAGFVRGKEIDALQLNRCVEKRETDPEVEKSIAEARSLAVNSTPTSFLNGRRLPGATPWLNLKQIIDFEIEYQKTAKNAGEQECCEVRLPSPLTNR